MSILLVCLKKKNTKKTNHKEGQIKHQTIKYVKGRKAGCKPNWVGTFFMQPSVQRDLLQCWLLCWSRTLYLLNLEHYLFINLCFSCSCISIPPFILQSLFFLASYKVGQACSITQFYVSSCLDLNFSC